MRLVRNQVPKTPIDSLDILSPQVHISVYVMYYFLNTRLFVLCRRLAQSTSIFIVALAPSKFGRTTGAIRLEVLYICFD